MSIVSYSNGTIRFLLTPLGSCRIAESRYIANTGGPVPASSQRRERPAALFVLVNVSIGGELANGRALPLDLRP